MATLTELARQHTGLDRAQINHLQRLVAEWGMLADFCFADLLLYAPILPGDPLADAADDGPSEAALGGPGHWLVLGQVRPVTSQTLYRHDWVGVEANASERPLLSEAYRTATFAEGEIQVETLAESTRMLAIPVVHEGSVIAVMTREWSPSVGRQPGELERTYLDIFLRFAHMIADGIFPFAQEVRSTEATPRVGDGVVVLDAAARVAYASPNAVSVLHRVGINANAVGLRLSELGFYDNPARVAFETRQPVTEEFEQTGEVVLLGRCLPLVDQQQVTGAVLLLRDMSEVRRRDRMLLSKDATIREIHHRVKNNLQTISSLLRLQARRLQSPEAKEAIAESVRRIRTIALVHETLSRDAGDEVAFIEIVRPLARMAEEGLQSPDRPVRFRVIGDGGKLPAATATPLAVVLTELLQNAVDHAFGDGASSGSVAIELSNDGTNVTVTVVDDGRGLPAGFELTSASGLGLSIVRTLVTTELAGVITMRTATPADFQAVGIDAASAQGPGTVVELEVPVSHE